MGRRHLNLALSQVNHTHFRSRCFSKGKAQAETFLVSAMQEVAKVAEISAQIPEL